MKPVVMLGEMLLRLKSPGHERLFQTSTLEATFGGAESNVAASLATFGIPTRFVTALPENPVGEACLRDLRSHGVDTSFIVRRGDRLGAYYLEAGSNQRPSRVVYDRAGSALATAPRDAFDWDAILAGARWLHLSGITPAVSASAAAIALDAARAARERGLPVSCDYNHRASLWKWGKEPREVMQELIEYCTVGIGGREDCQKMLGVQLPTPREESGVDLDAFRELCARVLARYPNLEMQVVTLREGVSADANAWSACLHDRHDFLVSRRYEIQHIVDRVGAGDAFSAGLLYGLLTAGGPRDALEFATAASCLKHGIPGDVNRVGVPEVEALVRGEGIGRVQR